MDTKRIVVVGGGTGTHTVLRGLKKYHERVTLTAIVSMADSGGSTGRLRDEFGQLPAGDVRNALTALAASGDEHDLLLRKIFMYRFAKGEGLRGHNFGNIFLTVLTDILGSEVAAIEAASKILRVSGRVIPVTIDKAELTAVYDNGEVIVGEHNIDEVSIPSVATRRIVDLSLQPNPHLYEGAAQALREADMIILGPGDLYTSVLANCVVPGFSEVLRESKANIVYICNLMSKAGQTIGLHAHEHLLEVIKYTKKAPDFMLCNDAPIPEHLAKIYDEEGNHSIDINYTSTAITKLVKGPLLADYGHGPVAGDTLKRSLVRHDSDKLADALVCL